MTSSSARVAAATIPESPTPAAGAMESRARDSEARSERPARGPALLAALAAFGITALVLPAAPGIGDSAELTLALALGGIPHPTGYPFWVMAGHLFVRAAHALGATWVVAANLWSAVGAAVAVGAFTRLAQHLDVALADADRAASRAPLRPLARRTAIALPAAALALNPVWLDAATIAEVYSWSAAWIAVAMAFTLSRLRGLGGVEPAADDARAAAVWGAIAGLCAVHHALGMPFVLTCSAALIAAQVRAGRWRASLAVAAVGGALVPLASYAWIPWRAAHPAAYQWPSGSSAMALWLHATGAAYTRYMGGFAPSAEQWELMRAGLLPWILPGLGLGSIAALRTATPLRWGLLALLGGAVLTVGFVVSYSVPDPAMYLLAALMASLAMATPGLRGLARRAGPERALALGVAIVVALAAWSVPRALAERARLATADANNRAWWSSIPFDRGIVLWADDHYPVFKALQLLEGLRPALYVENPTFLIWPARRSEFQRRFGFDPLEGLALRSSDDITRISENIRRRASVPVIVLPTGEVVTAAGSR